MISKQRTLVVILLATIFITFIPGPTRLYAQENPERSYESAAEYSRSNGGRVLVVIEGGELVYEDYEDSFSESSPHMLASVTKSFSAALYILGAMEGIWDKDELVSDTIKEWKNHPHKSEITIGHLLSLTSGLVDSQKYHPANVRNLDIYRISIEESVSLHPPGEAFIYGACNFHVLAALFQRKAGSDPVEYLYENLLSYLGFNKEHLSLWIRDRVGNAQMAGGAFFDGRALANYGQLFLQGGIWKGKELLDRELVQKTLTYENPGYQGYGLTWWLNRDLKDSYNPEIDVVPPDARASRNIMPGIPSDVFFGAGVAKQRLYVIPSHDLVVVRYGRGTPNFSDKEFLSHIMQ